ncbi:MAG: tape measure protein [Planctomycetota bacterium]
MTIARLQLVLNSQPMLAGARQVADALGRVTAAGQQADRATRALSGAQQAAAPAAVAAARAQREQAEALQQVARGMGLAGAAARLLGGALGGLTVVQVARQFLETADRAQLLAARLRLVATSAADAAATQAQLFRIAQQNGQSLEQLGTVYTRLARAGREAGASQDTMLQATEAIAAAMRVSGGDTASMNAALVQLAQGFASGTLRGEELNSVLEQAPRLAEAIATGMGVTVGQLRALGQEGELKTVPVLQALVSQLGKLKEESAALPSTVGTAWDRITQASGRFVANLNEALGITPKIAAGLDGVASVIERIAGLADTRGAFVRGSEFGRGLSNPDLQAQIDRYRTPNPLDLEAAADPDRRQAVLAALLREQNRRRFQSRAPITITAPAVTDRERQRAADDAADARRQAFEADQFRFEQARIARARLLALRQSMGLDLPFDPEQYEGQGKAMGAFMDRHPAWKLFDDRGRDASEEIRENLTRGMQSAVATFAEGLMTDGLSSARSFAAAFGGLLRRTVAEAFAASLTQRFITPFVNKVVGTGVPATTGGTSGGTATTTAVTATTSSGGAGALAMAGPIIAAASVFVGALEQTSASLKRFADLRETEARTSASIQSRLLRATGNESAADRLDREERNRQEIADLNRQRREQMDAIPFFWTGYQKLKRKREINTRFDQLINELLKAQAAEQAALGSGSIGDYNVAGGLNVAGLIGDIRRAVPVAPPAPPPPPMTPPDGPITITNLTVTTAATDAETLFDDIRRVARARAQAAFGSPGMAAEAFA